MSAELMPIIAFLSGAMVAAILSSLSVSRAARLQQEILKRGQVAHGRVLHVWRPKLWGAFTRIYFEFEPVGIEGTVRGCHVDRRAAGELRASLPAVGATVSVRYLPDQPQQAVIARLVSRFTD
ncbi:hypothetical protein JM946_21210 [Steroidobacter sp. S1-65]|uniref:DUF3592 domain-containing protein n=1 Tax=Steroidobacter gossypii TaxID=2805490 RepID=A0ABS1X238_9GAMM|nr:DUF3592 domain-containing protein [Steroidobacter gossypii]MBM0107264.1 hypothetical protein [Steroidobacter gossypii]